MRGKVKGLGDKLLADPALTVNDGIQITISDLANNVPHFLNSLALAYEKLISDVHDA
jgi:hypothetical protein